MMQLLKSFVRQNARWSLALVMALHASAMYAQVVGSDSLSGVWGADVRFGNPVHGQLTVDGRDQAWHASIGGFQVAAEATGREIRFTLPDNSAEFQTYPID